MRKLRTSLAQCHFHRLRHVVFQRALLLSAYRPASTPGASPVQAKRVVRRLLVPGRATGSNVIPEIEPVMALRIRLAMISYGSVSRMREFGSTADLNIFSMTSRRERVRLDGNLA